MSDTLTSLVSRVIYVGGEWLYVILATETDFFGVRFSNNESNPNPRFDTVPQSARTSNFEHPLTVVDWWPGMVAAFLSDAASGPRVSGDQDTDQAYRRGVAETQQRHQTWLDSLVSDAHDFADEHSLCSEFDRFMSEHGLPTRTRSYRVTLDVSTSVTVYVDASSEDSAADLACDIFSDRPQDYVDMGSAEIDVSSVEPD